MRNRWCYDTVFAHSYTYASNSAAKPFTAISCDVHWFLFWHSGCGRFCSRLEYTYNYIAVSEFTNAINVRLSTAAGKVYVRLTNSTDNDKVFCHTDALLSLNIVHIKYRVRRKIAKRDPVAIMWANLAYCMDRKRFARYSSGDFYTMCQFKNC